MFRPTFSLTVNNAKAALEGGLRAIASGQTEIDFTHVTVVDSAAIATLLEWQRAARARGAILRFANLPANLRSLAALYGVTDLLLPDMTLASSSEARSDLLHH